MVAIPAGSLRATIWTGRAVPIFVLALAAVCALLLALPGQTATTKYTNDLLVFLDGAYRISWGQVPNRDFHTALGPLSFYIPAAGYLLTGSLGAAMPVGIALVILLLAPVLAHVLHSRFSPLVAIPFAALILLVVAVPMNLGEGVTDLSFAMFYNRLGWAMLALLLVMYLRPVTPQRRQTLLDALSAGFLVAFLCYLKISYGAVAVGFLIFMLVFDPAQRRWAAVALAITVATGLIVEAFWRSSAAHLADILLAADVSGAVRGTLAERVGLVLRNLADITLYLLLVGFALRRTRSFRDLAFYGFCAASGFLLLNQNFQGWGMITLLAGGAVAAERLLVGGEASPARLSSRLALGGPLLFIGMVAFAAVPCAIALGVHAVAAATRAGDDFVLPGFEGVRLVELWAPGDHRFHSNYLNSIRNGALALAKLGPDAGRVYTLDFVTPFNAGLGLEPPRGDTAWQHWGRTFNEEHYLPPEDVLNDVKVVMEPKYPVEHPTYNTLREVYVPYVQANYELAAENVDWWVWVAKDQQSR